MSQNKNNFNLESLPEMAGNALRNSGLVLMSVATMAGIVELPHSEEHRGLVPQAAAVYAENSDGSTLRREKEEVGPHYISYSVAQRTPGRTRDMSID